jgi:hypothetical protein
MTAHTTPRKYRTKGGAAGVALLLGLFFTPIPANADELPVFRQGMWVFNRTIAGKSLEMRKCTDPNENLLLKAACKFSSIQKSGNRYTFVAECPARDPMSPELGGRMTVTLEAKSDSFYQVISEGVVDGQPVKEYLDARRSGDCGK